MKHLIYIFIIACLTLPGLIFAQESNDAIEPKLANPGVIHLLNGNTLDAWIVPSDHWYIKEECIVGTTGEEKLDIPEWLYTKQAFSDFEFTCELRLTGDQRRNTGIYYRVNTFLFEWREIKTYKAPSGYEFDASFHQPNRNNFWGSLGDWYARPSLRIFPDQSIINHVCKPGDWNRLTIRARGNRLEYWINGIKVMDYLDHDPNASHQGAIGFQIHDGSVMKVEYRNVRVLPLEQLVKE